MNDGPSRYAFAITSMDELIVVEREARARETREALAVHEELRAEHGIETGHPRRCKFTCRPAWRWPPTTRCCVQWATYTLLLAAASFVIVVWIGSELEWRTVLQAGSTVGQPCALVLAL